MAVAAYAHVDLGIVGLGQDALHGSGLGRHPGDHHRGVSGDHVSVVVLCESEREEKIK